MAIQTTELARMFNFNGIELPDPDPAKTPLQVRDFWAQTYAVLTSAVVEGPTIKNGMAHYEFLKAVRDKGAA